MSYEKLSSEFKLALTTELKTILKGDIYPPHDQLHGMLHYHMGWLDKGFNPADSPAGKQIRPMLLLLVCMGAGGDWRHAMPAAAAIELIHNFSLIHDDIEDRSETRRGRDTIWSIWGVPLGINAGDAMFSIAHLALHRLSLHPIPPQVIVASFGRFDETCLQLTQGQDADIRFEDQKEVDIEAYLEMITGKTSVLIRLCAELGGMLAGKEGAILENFREFGLNLGLAFQMLDDILGIWGDEKTIGKSATSDIVTRKKTLPILYGIQNDDQLRHLFVESEADLTPHISEIVSRLTDCGARDFAQGKAEYFTELALRNFKDMGLEGEAAVGLEELAAFLLMRQH